MPTHPITTSEPPPTQHPLPAPTDPGHRPLDETYSADAARLLDLLETSPAVLALASDDQLVAKLNEIEGLRARADAIGAMVVTEATRRRLPDREGAEDAAGWIRSHTGVCRGDAVRLVEIAQVAELVPEATETLLAGSLRAAHVRALARAATDIGDDAVREGGASLLASARGARPENFARRVRRWVISERTRLGIPLREAVRAERSLTEHVDIAKGLGVLHAELSLSDHAIVIGLLRALVEEQRRAERSQPDTAHDSANPGGDLLEPSLRNRMADALVEMARRAAGATVADRQRSHPLVMVHIDHDDLLGRLEGAGIATLADGTPIDAATARRLACDADLLPMVFGGSSTPLDLGRSRRLATTAQRQAMIARSATCEWPECGTRWEWCEAHHITPWTMGGATDLDQMAWLCHTHHGDVHEGSWQVTREADGTLSTIPPPDSPVVRRPYTSVAPTQTAAAA